MKTRYDIAVFIGLTQIAQICIDIEVPKDNCFDKAKALMRAVTSDELAYVDVYTKGQLQFRAFNDFK